MAREINLTEDDVKSLQAKLDGDKSGMTPEQVNFTEHLLRRGTEGMSAPRTAGSVEWTWTYRF